MCKNEYRKVAVREEYLQSLAGKEPVSEEPAKTHQDNNRFMEALDHNLMLLDEKHKIVFLLRY